MKNNSENFKHDKKNNPIDLLKRFWNFIWNGESFLSWITFLVIIFIFIKFIFFPSISYIMGTSLPIVIVESCSMYHGSDFDDWWNSNGNWYKDKGIEKDAFQSYTLINGFSKGDIFIVRGIKEENVKIGDVIIFAGGDSRRPIIHRVVNKEPIQTKGDNNKGQFTLSNNNAGINELDIKGEQIIGKATFIKIPFIGWLKLIFYEPLRPENERGFCKAS